MNALTAEAQQDAAQPEYRLVIGDQHKRKVIAISTQESRVRRDLLTLLVACAACHFRIHRDTYGGWRVSGRIGGRYVAGRVWIEADTRTPN